VLRAFIYIIRLHISPHKIYVNYIVSIGILLIGNRYKFGKSTYIQT